MRRIAIQIGVIVWTLLMYPLTASAQFLSWDDFMEQLTTEFDAEGEEAFMEAANLYDDYTYLHANPININSADSTELQRLGFLAHWQIEAIHAYIYRYGALRSVGELMLIPELDYHTRQLLSYFITFGEVSQQKESLRDTWHRMLTHGRSELSSRLDIPLYQRAGYAPRTQTQLEASPSHYYMGNALYHNLRYNYRYGTRLSWGISTEKDAGEPIFTKDSPLPDHISGYIQRLKNYVDILNPEGRDNFDYEAVFDSAENKANDKYITRRIYMAPEAYDLYTLKRSKVLGMESPDITTEQEALEYASIKIDLSYTMIK